MRLPNPVIPLDKHRVHAMSEEIEAWLANHLTGTGPLGERILLPRAPFDVFAPDGTYVNVLVQLRSVTTRSPYYIVSGGQGHDKQGRTYVVINVNGSIPQERIRLPAQKRAGVAAQIYPVLLHELTHAADTHTKGREGDKPPEADEEYYNTPAEVRAYMQEVVDEVQRSPNMRQRLAEAYGAGKGLEYLLKLSSTWKEIEPFLTEKNRRKIIHAVVKATEEVESMPSAKRKPNPAHPLLPSQPALRKGQHKIGMKSLANIRSNVEAGTVYHGQMADGTWATVGPYRRAVGRPQYAVFLKGAASVESSDARLIVAAFHAIVDPKTITTLRARYDNPAVGGRRENPAMQAPVAKAIIEAADKLGVKSRVTKDQAERILVVWLRARGLEQDRWGNYHHAPSGERYHFSKANIQRQQKFGPTWESLSSIPFVEAATNLLRGAAEATGTEKYASLAAKRKEAKAKAASKAEDKKLRDKANLLTMKALAFEDPKGVAANMRRETLPQAEYDAMRARHTELTNMFEKLLRDGAAPPQDEQFASADRPPIAPIYMGTANYLWKEVVDGVTYTIEVKNHQKGQAEIHIGRSSDFGLAVSALTHNVTFSGVADAKGDAYISGLVVWNAERKQYMAALFLISSREKQKGAGSRVLDLWCRMMKGYGTTKWAAQAVGEEGLAFLKARARAGKIKILGSQGSNLLVQCL